MKTLSFAIVASMAVLSAAHAQSLAPAANASDVDNAASLRVGGYSPGTIGAMNAVVSGLATSPEDVLRQQAGHAPLAEGRATFVRPVATQVPGQSGQLRGHGHRRPPYREYSRWARIHR